MNHQLFDSSKLVPLSERDRELEELWGEFADVPVDPDTERIEDDFICFPHGTPKEDVWHWFDERYSKGVYHLIYGFGGIDRTDRIAKTLYLYELCEDCETGSCAYNESGECRFSLVHERPPRKTEDDGCVEGVIASI